jgi:phage baseplate assembly protein W
MAELALAMPFSIDPYGKLTVTTDQSKIWADRVRSVIGTALKERVMRPTFGTRIPFTVFNTQEDADSEINREVVQAFNEQLALLKLQNVTTSFDTFTGVINITINYSLPNDIQISTNIGIATIQGNNPIYEETV